MPFKPNSKQSSVLGETDKDHNSSNKQHGAQSKSPTVVPASSDGDDPSKKLVAKAKKDKQRFMKDINAVINRGDVLEFDLGWDQWLNDLREAVGKIKIGGNDLNAFKGQLMEKDREFADGYEEWLKAKVDVSEDPVKSKAGDEQEALKNAKEKRSADETILRVFVSMLQKANYVKALSGAR